MAWDDEATGRARERQLFGAPLADLQMVQASIADMALAVDAAALLVYRAAWTKDSARGRIYREDLVHLGRNDHDRWDVARRHRSSGQTGARAPRKDGPAVRSADADHGRHFRGRQWKAHHTRLPGEDGGVPAVEPELGRPEPPADDEDVRRAVGDPGRVLQGAVGTVIEQRANAGEAGIWMGGGAIAVDANTNLFFQTGNGIFTATNGSGGTEYGDSNHVSLQEYFVG